MGGKSREIPRMTPMFPNEIKRVIEPFAGSCAVAFSLEKPALVSDINFDAINLLQVVKNPIYFDQLHQMVLKAIEDGPQEKEYYQQRNILNDPNEKNPIKKAFSFLYVRQLCFSGLHRITKTGKFSVPFGWGYKKFSTPLNEKHHELLQSWEINLSSFETTLQQTKSGDFIFIDPPYYERNSEYAGGHTMGVSEKLHIDLFNILKDIKEPWMVVHVDCDLYQDLYKNFNITSLQFQYSMNFMGRKSSSRDVKHLYITNYDYKKNIPLF